MTPTRGSVRDFVCSVLTDKLHMTLFDSGNQFELTRKPAFELAFLCVSPCDPQSSRSSPGRSIASVNAGAKDNSSRRHDGALLQRGLAPVSYCRRESVGRGCGGIAGQSKASMPRCLRALCVAGCSLSFSTRGRMGVAFLCRTLLLETLHLPKGGFPCEERARSW